MASVSSRPCVVIAGGSGFVGRALTEHLLARGTDVIVLTREGGVAESGSRAAASRPVAGLPPESPIANVRRVTWDARTLGPWARELEGATALVNLVGRSVDCVKTPEQRDQIVRSRVESTLVLGEAVRACERPPPVWVQMSTAHIYGDPPEAVCDEETTAGVGFAPEVGTAWEAAFAEAAPPYVRRVVLRTSFVLGRDRGSGASALGRLARLARLGLGGTVGHGRQGISWIHEDDMSALFERAIGEPSMRGVYVATAPNPVSNAEFMRELRRVLRVPIGLPSPEFMVRLGARVLRTDPELALYGRYCVSSRLPREGFTFRFTEVGGALADLLAPDARVQGTVLTPHQAGSAARAG